MANLSVCTTVPGERLVSEENRHNENHDCRASTTIVALNNMANYLVYHQNSQSEGHGPYKHMWDQS